MMKNKKIALLASILMVTLAAGVYAGLQLSNTLTANFTVAESAPFELTWANNNPNDGTFYKGIWYSTDIRLYNPTEATFKILMYFKITSWGANFPSESLKIKYYEVLTDTWLDLPLSGWDSAVLTGTFGPTGGLDCGPHYDITGYFKFMFEGDAPVASYTFNVWVEQVP